MSMFTNQQGQSKRSASSRLPMPHAQPIGAHTPRRLQRASEILNAAREVFLEKGFARSSVGEIAAKVGVVEGLVYSYYPSKRELLNAVLRGMYEPLIADLEEKFSKLHGVRSRLRFLIWRHLRVYVEDPNLSRLVLHEVRTGPEYFQSDLHELHVRYTAFLMRTVQDAIAEGELRADTDVELLRSLVYGGIEHRMWGTLFGRGKVDVEAMADRFTDMILGPLLPLGQAHTPLMSNPHGVEIAQALGDMRKRLDRIEQAVMSPAAQPKTCADVPQAHAPTPLRRKSKT
jgi:AcrR family transcriptional regulator